MDIKLTQEERAELEVRHRHTRDGRVRDRIKAVLLRNKGWSHEQIATALILPPETSREHVKAWAKEKEFKPRNGGSKSALSEDENRAIQTHLEEQVYTRVIDIGTYIQQHYEVKYTVSGMTKWLKQQGFRYKKPKGIPLKADTEKQAQFIVHYEALKTQVPSNEPIVFMDAVHPTMATKISYSWIRKGTTQAIKQSASRTRVNLIGAIEMGTLKRVTQIVSTVNAQTTGDFLRNLKIHYPNAHTIHVILDQSGYHRSQALRTLAQHESIELHYLPPYSPNLNPIERLWKFINKHIRNNRLFHSPQHFREVITQFFDSQLAHLTAQLRSRITEGSTNE